MELVHPGLRCEAAVATPTNPDWSARMNVHKNARMTVYGRVLMVRRVIDEGWRASGRAASGCFTTGAPGAPASQP